MDKRFLKILSNEEPGSFVYRDELVSAFMDIEPINPGHVLVVPNKLVANLAELDEETGARLFNVARKIAAAIRASDLRCDGVNLFLADGEAAGQEVFHLHLHVVPRFKGDGFQLQFPKTGGVNSSREELDRVAELILKGPPLRAGDHER